MEARSSYKIFNDPVHGTIKLAPLLVKIIDTPEFQRLRHIKQLGGVYYIYPGAQHNRFEHSIGTAHLAGKLVRHLKDTQPELGIDDQDIRCVEIAGLCHDLGHGPFSHLFDGSFIPRCSTKQKHDKVSCDMFDRIMDKMPVGYRLPDDDRLCVKGMIDQRTAGGDLKKQERYKKKTFLFEIISNKKSGVDVDKWDYFARDCHHLGIANGFDHNRFIQFTRVIKDEKGDSTICVRDKEVFNLYEMFHTRFTLHKRAYQHKAVNAVEHMICDAMVAANDHVRILGNGTENGCKISDCIKDGNLGSFCNLDDSILHKILLWVPENGNDSDPESRRDSGKDTENEESQHPLETAKDILNRLTNGRRYKCVGNKILGEEACKLKADRIKQALVEKDDKLSGQLRVSVIMLNYGSHDQDPIRNYRFYKKGEESKTIKIQKEEVSLLLPDLFEETVVQVFCISENAKIIEAAETAFEEWYKKPEPSTKQLLRKFVKGTEELEVVKKWIKEIHDSLEKKE